MGVIKYAFIMNDQLSLCRNNHYSSRRHVDMTTIESKDFQLSNEKNYFFKNLHKLPIRNFEEKKIVNPALPTLPVIVITESSKGKVMEISVERRNQCPAKIDLPTVNKNYIQSPYQRRD
ncbi:hypothetical protein P3S68_026117 [Capsicum galapagoense]